MFNGAFWVDLLIIAVFVFFASEAWKAGFWVILFDFLSFLTSLLISLRVYPKVADILQAGFTLNRSTSNALGFLLVAIIAEAAIGLVLAMVLRKLPDKWKRNKLVKPAAIIPAIGETMVIVSFFLILIMSFPVSPKIKSAIGESKIGGFLVNATSNLEVQLSNVFGGIIEDSLTHLIIKPGSNESVSLDVDTLQLSIDEKAESEMLALVNEDRKANGLWELTYRAELVPVARAHARDMWERDYFGHVSPEGKDVGDRLEEANIFYFIAGENLALAPTTPIAHRGLMNSPGHRANILSRDFKRMGIGVVDNDVYGKMYVQIFTD